MNEEWETRVQDVAKTFSYPPTPDLAGAVRRQLARRARPAFALHQRRLAWAAVIGVLVIIGLTATPGVRAKVMDIIGLDGGLLAGPTPTLAAPTFHRTPGGVTVTELPTVTSTLTATPRPPSTPLSSSTAQSAVNLIVYSPARPEATRPNISP